MHAAMRGDENLVQLLLDKGADIKVMNQNGLTALSWAKLMDDQGDHQGVIRRLEKAEAKK
jgi:ankyrin repeat protein